jgi:hypothetical protein
MGVCETIDLSFEVEVAAVIEMPVAVMRLTLCDKCREFLSQFGFLFLYLEAASLLDFGGHQCEWV